MPTTDGAEEDAPASPPRARGNGARALGWWRSQCDPNNHNVDPATRARLRRARAHLDVLRVAPAVELARSLGGGARSAPGWRTYAALDLARVLAHVKAHEERHPMRAAGWKEFPRKGLQQDPPKLSDTRFKRLLETGEGDEKVVAFTRLVALLGGSVNVAQLASDFLAWNHPELGERVRERWAFEYLAAGSAAPPAPTIESEDDGE